MADRLYRVYFSKASFAPGGKVSISEKDAFVLAASPNEALSKVKMLNGSNTWNFVVLEVRDERSNPIHHPPWPRAAHGHARP